MTSAFHINQKQPQLCVINFLFHLASKWEATKTNMTYKGTYIDCSGELEKHSALVFVVDAASCPPVGFRLSIDCLVVFLIVLCLSKGGTENRSIEGQPQQPFHTLT